MTQGEPFQFSRSRKDHHLKESQRDEVTAILWRSSSKTKQGYSRSKEHMTQRAFKTSLRHKGEMTGPRQEGRESDK